MIYYTYAGIKERAYETSSLYKPYVKWSDKATFEFASFLEKKQNISLKEKPHFDITKYLLDITDKYGEIFFKEDGTLLLEPIYCSYALYAADIELKEPYLCAVSNDKKELDILQKEWENKSSVYDMDMQYQVGICEPYQQYSEKEISKKIQEAYENTIDIEME